MKKSGLSQARAKDQLIPWDLLEARLMSQHFFTASCPRSEDLALIRMSRVVE
jgi:hypothetical protein